jgi:hypothetical protein
MHSHWRDFDAWRAHGLTFDTSSNEACKLYDAALTQYVGWYDIDQMNGLDGTVKSIIKADPDFLMGHVVDVGLQLVNCPENFKAYEVELRNLNLLKEKKQESLTKRELLHVEALNILACGDLPKSCECWEEILVGYPHDLLALKFAHDSYFYLGYSREMRDSVAHVLPLWKPSTPLYGYLYGMQSFGLSQTNFFNQAERAAQKGLELNRNDAWSTHTLCHINEYRNTAADAIRFLRNTETDWAACNLLAKHNYWHLALYHLERNEHDLALKVFDENIFSPSKNLSSYFDIVDACALLYRLKLDNCKEAENNSERWSRLKDACLPLLNDNGFAFNDIHIFMSLSACGDKTSKISFIDTFQSYLTEPDPSETYGSSKIVNNYLKKIKKNIASKIYTSIEHFDNGDFDRVVETLYPIRYEIIKVGGSNAQRDVFHQLLTQSALRSKNQFHNKIGISLLHERNLLKPTSKLNERIASRFASTHTLD